MMTSSSLELLKELRLGAMVAELKKQMELCWCKYYNKTPEDFRKRYYCNYL